MARPAWAVRALLVLGGVLAALSMVAGHANRVLLDGPTFAEKLDEVRRAEPVAEQVGTAITRQLLRAQPDLVALRPLVQAISVEVAGSNLLSGPVRQTAERAHAVLTEEGGGALVLRIADAGAVVAGVLGALAPERAPGAPQVSVTLASLGDQSFAGATIDLARTIDLLAWLLPLAALASLAAAVLLATDRWAAAARAGLAAVVASAAVGAGLVAGGFLVRRTDDDTLSGAVAQAAWQVFVRPLWWTVLLVAAAGLVVSLAAGAAVPAALFGPATRLRAAVLERPATSGGRLVRALLIGAVGLAAVADPRGVVELAAFVAGVVLVLHALREVGELAAPARGRRAAEAPSAGGWRLPPRAAYGAIGLAVVVLLTAAVWRARPGDDVAAAAEPPAEGCNGHPELCDRPFDDVAYVASHNSMSVAKEPGWFLAEQVDPIPVQLDQGVRALLIDVWSGRPAGSVVRTAPSSYEEALAVAEEELGPEVVAAATRIADSLAGVAEGPEARYLCHGLCETGATSFLGTLGELRAWMAAHPGDVVTLFIEDHVDADLIAADVEAAGLLDLVHTPVAGAPWPTLGEMVESGRRLVVMLEEGEGGPEAPWLVNGFRFTQETPYTIPSVDTMDCAENRGPADAPLFLLNHWLFGFRSLVTDAQQMNARDLLLPRAEQCRDERGQIPNFVAVNFVAIGDVVAVVDALNGVG